MDLEKSNRKMIGSSTLKSMTLKEHLTEETSNRLFKELRASMQAMSKISVPYDVNVKSRKDALIDRYSQIKPKGLDIDVERAVYVRTKDQDQRR